MRARTKTEAAALILVLTAVGASAVVLTTKEAANARQATTRFMLTALASWDLLHERTDPHPPFTRAPRIVDPRPLSAQARAMWNELESRFLIGGKMLVTTTPPVEIGDLCLWQGVYAAAAAFEHDLRRTDASRRRAEAAFDGLRELSTRGRPIARAVLPAGIETENPGRWHFKAGGVQWKEDASIDSAAGYVFGAVVAAELLPSRREAALEALRGFADAMIEGGFYLRNSDGSRTRFSTMGGSFVSSPVGVTTSLAALSALERAGLGARYSTARERLERADQDVWGSYGSAPAFWRNVTTNHNIAILSLSAVMLGERDPKRWDVYANGLLRINRMTERMGNSFWSYLTEWTLQRRPELARNLKGREMEHFRAARLERRRRARVSMLEWDYPRGKTKAAVWNSKRDDLPFVRWTPLGRLEAAEPIPVHERPGTDFVWQRSPYQLDGWTDYEGPPQEFAPLDFLVAYSLGRLTGNLSSID